MPSKELQQIYKHIDDHQPEHVQRLRDWIKQPSVSNTGEGIPECAEMTRRYFQDIVGCQKTEVVDVGVTEWGAKGNPVVYAEYDAGAPKTVILYMMYDTMPIFDVKQWRRHPYAADIIEQPPFKKVVIGRGAVNSKGPQMAMINSMNSIRAVAGKLPVNVFIIAEGDEERMSIGLRKFVHMRKDRLSKAQAMLGFGRQSARGVAIPHNGSEGCLYIELETSGKRWGKGPYDGPIHGGYKRTVDSPAWRHIKMLSTLVDDTGNKILVDGWYDNMEGPTKADQPLIEETLKLVNMESSARNLRIGGFIDELDTPRDMLMQALYGTSFNLDGIWGGLTEPGTAGSIMPDKVTSKHNCRYVPHQDGPDLLKKLRRHLDEHGYSDVEIRVIGDVPSLNADYNSDLSKALFRMYEQFGVQYEKLPGTGVAQMGPYWPGYLFGRDPLKLQVAMGGLGHGGRAHAIDEFFVIEGNDKVYGLAGAEKGFATILYNFAGLN
ncbi:MAG: M20/M25/M40 family metallo-hydrolase [SAR202 cluster bacterium]|nr:M20/M25/M40 family metallo-hydrolase [SAR202 cluster bacterium]